MSEPRSSDQPGYRYKSTTHQQLAREAVAV